MSFRDQVPTSEQIEALDHELRVSPGTAYGDEVSAVLDWLREERPNGGAHLARFRFGPHPVLDWFATRNRLPELNCMLDHPVVRGTLPAEFQQPFPLPEAAERYRRGWIPGVSMQLSREWAWSLYAGGMHTSVDLTLTAEEREQRAHRAIDAGQALYSALFRDRYAAINVYRTPDPWCAWFPGLFNSTWAAYDLDERTLLLLCVTDMD
ncbi:hypothetical protein ABT337_23215 [Saccharopolyspora hirsuta]|uniref:Uncharacterized protein n=1 Tax=Saccharopolyspora hirsuta TaxID=1837 RepID=A0A5M7C8T7_SACHI|nr:hypothetical protein [Saccharopolyspora hirsuta]KAA5836074.1 hypothetical protein F1721_06975 [Saccharopolyspora hirsuta]